MEASRLSRPHAGMLADPADEASRGGERKREYPRTPTVEEKVEEERGDLAERGRQVVVENSAPDPTWKLRGMRGTEEAQEASCLSLCLSLFPPFS